MPRKRRSVSNRIVRQYAERLEQVRQSPELYATTPCNDDVVSYSFDQHANLLSLTGRGISRARLWRAHVRAGRKALEELPSYALQTTQTYSNLTEAFDEAETATPQIVAEQLQPQPLEIVA